MTDIFWVYGSSAAGKETFIRRLLSKPPQNLIDYLGWKSKKIICIEESLKYIGQFENDPITKKRSRIIDRAKEVLDSEDTVVLIKGQDVDLKSGLPSMLLKELPKAKHQIIFLHADLQLLYERSRKKTWWSKEDEEAGIEGFKDWLLNDQLKYLLELEGFNITALDSSSHNYKPIKFPPKI